MTAAPTVRPLSSPPIAFLGSVSIDGSDHRRFWYDVTTRLNQLGNLMTARELKQFEQDRSELGESLKTIVRARRTQEPAG
jgi:hypothetical protein